MKSTFRKHGKWLFIPTPVIVLTGALLSIPQVLWLGIALMLLLIGILVTQKILKLELID